MGKSALNISLNHGTLIATISYAKELISYAMLSNIFLRKIRRQRV